MARLHTDREFEGELNALRERLLLMGGHTEDMIAGAVQAALDGDLALARATIAKDNAVDQDELDIDERCLRIMARRQPVGPDLRFVAFAFKIVTDLERIGDLATSICRRVIEENVNGPVPAEQIAPLGKAARDMVHLALNAFANGDAATARRVLDMDEAVDDLYHELFRSLLAQMGSGKADIGHCVRLQSIAKQLERIGDHATNVAEQVIFLVDGSDVRHRGHAGG